VSPAAEALPETPPQIPSARRFCRECGSPWDANAAECVTCAQKRAVRVTPGASHSDVRDVKLAIGLYFALLALSAILLITALNQTEPLGVSTEFFASITTAVITLLWCAVFRRDVWPLLARLPKPRWFAAAIGCALVTYCFASAMIGMVRFVFDLPDIQYLETFTAEGYGLGWAVLCVAVCPGIFEELAFRGVILSPLCRVLKRQEAMIVCALMFAILHLQAASMPHLFVIGYLLCWLRLRTGSLYPSIVMHFTHNLLVVLSEAYPGISPW
jgi:membrane protease YdiL (CAAX protease family)